MNPRSRRFANRLEISGATGWATLVKRRERSSVGFARRRTGRLLVIVVRRPLRTGSEVLAKDRRSVSVREKGAADCRSDATVGVAPTAKPFTLRRVGSAAR